MNQLIRKDPLYRGLTEVKTMTNERRDSRNTAASTTIRSYLSNYRSMSARSTTLWFLITLTVLVSPWLVWRLYRLNDALPNLDAVDSVVVSVAEWASTSDSSKERKVRLIKKTYRFGQSESRNLLRFIHANTTKQFVFRSRPLTRFFSTTPRPMPRIRLLAYSRTGSLYFQWTVVRFFDEDLLFDIALKKEIARGSIVEEDENMKDLEGGVPRFRQERFN